MHIRPGIVCIGLLFSSLLQAHHSTSLYVDVSQSVAITGTLEKVNFTNPHVVIQFYAPDAKGANTLWSAETHSPNVLAKLGWKPGYFHKGDKVTIAGNPSRDGSPYIQLSSVKFADGYELSPAKKAAARTP